MTTLRLELPPKLIPVFSGEARYRGAYGGRGSAKTRTFAKMAAVFGLRFAKAGKEGIILCGREFMNSLDDSSMAEVKAAIASEPWLADNYDVGEKYIRTKCGRVNFKFAGLRHNLDSIKSKALILILWVDEADPVSEVAWIKAIPSVREQGSEIWVTWNPEVDGSATDRRFRKDPPEGAKIVEINWNDNPWFPDVLRAEMERDRQRDPDKYNHVWCGGYEAHSERRVFKRWQVGERTPPSNIRWFYGADWGFAVDPTAALRACVMGDELYVDYEAVEVGCAVERTPTLLGQIPDAQSWPIRADSARPETIDYVKRHGFPLIKAANKGKNSVKDGITFLQGFDIVVHPRCAHLINELTLYSYKVDEHTGDILPELVDANNHCIDALRYAVEGQHRRGERLLIENEKPKKRSRYDRAFDGDSEESSWKTV